DEGEEIPTDGPMMTGDVAAVAIPAPTRIRTTTTSFRVIRAMLLPPAGGCAGGSQTLCRHARVAKPQFGDPETQPMGGRCCAQGRNCSNAAAARMTVASAKRRPTICNPTGNPSDVNPAGTEAAGCPVRLNGYVKGIHA